MATQIQSNLTPIMFTDMVNYSKMVSKNEKASLRLLEEHNEIIFPIIKANDGKIIKLIGDAIFARFKTPLGSVRSAIEIQSKLKDRNSKSSKDERIQIRIGLHTGQVVEKDDDLFGHDVNLCSRIKGVSQPGSITISEEIYTSVSFEKEIFHRKIGHVKLKNIPDPKILYKTYIDSLDFEEESDKELNNSFEEKGIEIVDIEKYESQQIRSIGVLYFTNLGTEEDEYHCHNFTKDLIEDFQSVKKMRVPSLNDISKYKNQDQPLSEVARKLQVNQLIWGSLFIKNEKASINVEFLDTDLGKTLWSQSWEIDLNTITHVHNQILENILGLLELDIPENLKNKFMIKTTDSPEADKEYKKARYLIDLQKKKEDLSKADEHLAKAIKYDSKFLYAHAQRGVIAFKLGEYEKSEERLNIALELAEKDGSNISNGYVYLILGQLYIVWGKHKQALKYNKKAFDVYTHLERPLNEAAIIHNLATSFKNLGDQKEALSYFQKSLGIKKEYGDRLLQASSYGQIGNVQLEIGNYSEAINYLKRSLAIYRDFGHYFNEGLATLIVIEAYIEIGQFDEAKNLIDQAESILEEYKDPTIKGLILTYRGTIEFYESNSDAAISHLESSIEQFQIAQKSEQAFQAYLLLIQIFIHIQKFSQAEKILDKIKSHEKKVQSEEFLLRAAALRIFILALNDKEITEAYKERIKNDEVEIRDYFSYWYIALAYSLKDDELNAKEYLIKAQNLLKEKGEKDSNKSYWDAILNTNPINKQIIVQDEKSVKEFTDSLKKETVKVEISKFCTECGYSNVSLQPFCPECGNKLKK